MSLLDTASLLLTPNAYKEGKLYSVIPSDGSGDFTFTRATTATRVNSDGLVELVPYNLLTYSEQFDNAAWTKLNSTITANAETAPNGTLTADLFNSNGTLNNHRLEQAIAFVPTTKTYSVYAKANDASFIQISAAFNTDSWVNFDLSNGTLSNQGSGYIGSISNVGNGWYLCSVYTADAAATSLRISIVTNLSSARIETNSISGGVYVWGAQVNEGTILPYQKTETRLNIPRLDYSLGGCPSILLEPQRTNIALQSSSFDSGFWTKLNSIVTPNVAISPSGVQDADLYTTSSTSEYVQQTLSLTSGTTYTFSIFVKYVDEPIATFVLTGTAFSPALGCNYDLINETATPTTPLTTGTIQAYDNGWYRITITGTAIASGAGVLRFASISATPVINFNIWGAQLEVGAYATSYIPTTTASVTRNNDSCLKTSATALIGQTEGTVFWEGAVAGISALKRLFSFSDGTTNNAILLQNQSNGRNIQYVIVVGGVIQFTLAVTNAFNYGESFKVAFAYANNDFVIYINGVQKGVSISGSVPTTNKIAFDRGNDTTPFEGFVKTAAIWKERLTNDQLAQLTTI